MELRTPKSRDSEPRTPTLALHLGRVAAPAVRVHEQRLNNAFTTFGVADPLRASLAVDAGVNAGARSRPLSWHRGAPVRLPRPDPS